MKPSLNERIYSSALLADLAWGDPMYASSAELDASVERDARRARWIRRKGDRR